MTADLSSHADLITQLRSRVEAMAASAVQERDGLRAERDRVMKAFLHVFPYDFYAELRPDLSDRTNEDRAIHFVCHGINEGVSLEYSRLCASFAATHEDECKPLVARLNELESIVSQYSARLSVVQDLFVRLSMEKRGS